MLEDSETKSSTRQSDEHLSPDLELQAPDPKSQEKSKFLVSSQNSTAARHFGNNCVFCFRRNEPMFTLGPHWCVAFIMINFFLVGGVCLAEYIAASRSLKLYYATYVVTFVHSFSYIMVAIMNPGIASTWQTFDESEMIKENRCKVCRVKKSSYVVHCLDCDICVRGLDHHCPWVGKCVGEKNQKWFNLFILCTFCYIIYTAFLLLNVF